MKVDVTHVLKSLKGKPLTELERYDNPNFVSTEETPNEQAQHTRKKEVTLRDVCVNMFAIAIDSDKGASGVEKNKWFVLSLKIYEQDKPEFSPEEIVLLKKRIGKIYPSIVVGRAYELLDPVEGK